MMDTEIEMPVAIKQETEQDPAYKDDEQSIYIGTIKFELKRDHLPYIEQQWYIGVCTRRNQYVYYKM